MPGLAVVCKPHSLNAMEKLNATESNYIMKVTLFIHGNVSVIKSECKGQHAYLKLVENCSYNVNLRVSTSYLYSHAWLNFHTFGHLLNLLQFSRLVSFC